VPVRPFARAPADVPTARQSSAESGQAHAAAADSG